MFGMILDNVWVQLVILLIFIVYGIIYVVKGAGEVDKRSQMAGILLLTLGWSKAVFFLEKWNLNPHFKRILDISEIVVPLAGLIIAVFYVKKWRPYVVGAGLILTLLLGSAYMRISRKAAKSSLKVANKSMR